MTNNEAINLLRQVNKILVSDKSWLKSTHEPLNKAFDMAIKALEVTDTNVGNMELVSKQAAILNQIITEIEMDYEGCDICEWFDGYDCDDNPIAEYMPVGYISDIINIINKHRITSEPVGHTEVKYDKEGEVEE